MYNDLMAYWLTTKMAIPLGICAIGILGCIIYLVGGTIYYKWKMRREMKKKKENKD